MRFEDQPSGDQPGTGAVPPPPPPAPADPAPPRRRSPRSWSTPSSTPPPPPPAPTPGPSRFTRPAAERDWSSPSRRFDPSGPAPSGDRPPRPQTALGAPPVDLSPVLQQLRDLRADLAQVRAAVADAAGAAPSRDATMVTGAELAATIDALGSTLGNGMATLLTEHRNLLARDVDAAADRILEELAQRLRAGATQTADAVEERQRQVLAKSLNDLGEQLDLRLEQLQSDVAGLRAVMLELPDQTAISERLDHVVEAVAATRTLTTEVAALRRRITVRADRTEEGLSDERLDELADRVAARLRPATRARTRVLPDVDEEPEEAPEPEAEAEVDEDERPAPRRRRR